MLWFFWPQCMWDLSFPTRDRTHTCALEGKVLTTAPPGKFPFIMFCKDLLCCLGFPGGASGKEPVCQCRRHKILRFDPWVRKISWRMACQSIPVFLPGESHRQRSLAGVHSIAKHQTQLKRLSMRVWMQARTVFPMWRCYLGSFCNKSGGRCSRNGTCNVWMPRTVPVAWSAAVSVWCGYLQTPACSLVFSGQVHCPRNLSSSPPSLPPSCSPSWSSPALQRHTCLFQHYRWHRHSCQEATLGF